MSWLALKMLFHDRTKLGGIVFGVTFASLLIAQQASIFCGLMLLTTSQIKDIRDAPLWVMDPDMSNIDNIKPLRDTALQRVRGAAGIEWAVPLFKSQARARLYSGEFRTVLLLGVDDATLIGAPYEMVAGSLEALRQPEAVIVDERGYRKMWPQGPIETGRTFEMNDRRAVVVGVCRASQTFQGFPVIYTRYSRALQFIPPRRKVLSFILAGNHPDYSLDEAAGSVIERTGLLAVTRDQFFWMTIRYYLGETGIPINFGITVLLGFLVGTAVAGQTFYLFTVENLDQYATLKAMGATNSLIASIVLQQALLVGFVGYGTGAGLAALFGVFARATDRLEFFMPWHVLVGTGVAVLFIVLLTAMLSLRRLFRLDPAEVFRI